MYEERIGKDQAEEEYHKTIEPLLKVGPRPLRITLYAD
jgi:hypothetical protein